MEFIQLLRYVLMTEKVGASEGNELLFLVELVVLCAEPLHQLWTVLKRRAFMEKGFAVVIFGLPVFFIMMIQTLVMQDFFSYKNFLQYRETREIVGQASLYHNVILINVITVLLILFCSWITAKSNKQRGKHKLLVFLGVGGLEFVGAILMIGFSCYILMENPWFLFERSPDFALAYIYIGWHMVLKSAMLLGVIFFSVIFYKKEQGAYKNELDARGYLEKHISQQGRFMTIASGLYLLVQCPVTVMVLQTTFADYPAGEEIEERIVYIVTMLIANIFFLGVTVVLLGVFHINIKRWLKPESDMVFKAMEGWGNPGYIIQTLCAERYKSEERIYKSRGYEVTENFIYRPCLYWKYDLFYLRQLKSVTQAVGLDGVYTVLTFRDGKKFKAYHMQKDVIAHIKTFLPQEQNEWT